MPDWLISEVRETPHRGGDDLLSAGLGLDGLRSKPAAFADPAAPTPLELRRRAIQANWAGIADLGPLGGYGRVYGAVPDVPGREYQAFARIPGASSPHRVLLQAPDAFDADARCLLVAPASGSRGVYGAIALAGAWGLPRGCAVVYTDKGAGTGYFDAASASGVRLDGTRAAAGEAMLEFEPRLPLADGIAIKHAHSGDHPEAAWGRHVLQAAEFGLALLERAYPGHAPFTPANTRIVAVGLSNGAGAALQAAGLDEAGVLAGVVALEPNARIDGHGRPLYDYATEAALLLPCALADARFEAVPFARQHGTVPVAWSARAEHLRATGAIVGSDRATLARSALERLEASGWATATLEAAAATTAFDLWRVISATYASAYLRASADAMPAAFRIDAVDAANRRCVPEAATRAAWWAEGAGIPPGGGLQLAGGIGDANDPSAVGIETLRGLWTGSGTDAAALRTAVAATRAQLPRSGLPIVVAQGEGDGLLPIAFSGAAYVEALTAAGRHPTFWHIPHAQHFDAFLALPGFGDRHVPLLPYGYAALDALWSHLLRGEPLPVSRRWNTQPRGSGALERDRLDL